MVCDAGGGTVVRTLLSPSLFGSERRSYTGLYHVFCREPRSTLLERGCEAMGYEFNTYPCLTESVTYIISLQERCVDRHSLMKDLQSIPSAAFGHVQVLCRVGVRKAFGGN